MNAIKIYLHKRNSDTVLIHPDNHCGETLYNLEFLVNPSGNKKTKTMFLMSLDKKELRRELSDYLYVDTVNLDEDSWF